ncbi:MAG: hypothetical protein IJ365_08965, partial [Clostridia bacterium]|nr:hypothetical protein [Clostridia bacterium]
MLAMKKFISVIVAIAMLFSVMTTPVLAQENTVVVETETESDTNTEESSEARGDGIVTVDGAVEIAEQEENEQAENDANETTEDDADIYSDENNAELQSVYDEAVLMSDADTSGVIVLEGEGTKENPYKIYTEEELIAFAVGEFEDGLVVYWELENDIVLTADTWAPIGAYTPFSGVFDGKGHTISSSKLFQSTAMSGIFGQNAGTIKNLNIDVTIEEVATNTGT